MAVLTLEQKLDLGASDLRFLLTNHGIKDDRQGALFEAGVDTMAKFAAFVTTATDLVEVLKKEFSLDPATSLANRAQVASYTVAWQSARRLGPSSRRRWKQPPRQGSGLSPFRHRITLPCGSGSLKPLGSPKTGISPLRSTSRRSWPS